MKIGYLKPGILLLVLLFSFRQDLFAKKRITSLKCEYIETPLGLDVQRPRLMWKVDTSDVPSRQTAYRILVSSTPELLRQGEADIWDSGKQKSDEQLVSYAGSTLRPHTRYWWRVRRSFRNLCGLKPENFRQRIGKLPGLPMGMIKTTNPLRCFVKCSMFPKRLLLPVAI